MEAPNNPYRPPSARVEDVMDLTAAMSRPRAASIAVWLLWAMIAIEILEKLRDGHEEWRLGTLSIVANAITMGLVGLMCWLIFMIGRRRNWARITYAVLFALGMFFHLMNWRNTLHGPPRDLIAIVLQTALQVSAMVLLFQSAANGWFRPRRDPARV